MSSKNIGAIYDFWWEPRGTTHFSPPIFSIPTAPQMFVASPENTSAILNWMPPAFDGHQPILYYERRHDDGTGIFGAWANIGLVFTETITALTNGTTYIFEVRAVNSIGEGPAASDTTIPAIQATNRLMWDSDEILWSVDYIQWE